MKNASFLRRKNLIGGLAVATLVTGATGPMTSALTAKDYEDLASGYNAKPIEEGAMEFTRVDVKNNQIYAKVTEGRKIEWVRVAYRKNGEREMRLDGMINLVGFNDELEEASFSAWGYKEVGMWTAFQTDGGWSKKMSSRVEGYNFGTEEKALHYNGTAKLNEIDERVMYYAIKGREDDKAYYWVGEIDYSGCYLDECTLNTEKSTEIRKVFTGGEDPNAGASSGTTGTTPGTTTGGTGETVLPTTDPTDKESELDLTDKEEEDAATELEDEGEEGEGEETGEKEEIKSEVKKPAKKKNTKTSSKSAAKKTSVATGLASVYSGALSTNGNAVSRASKADSSGESDKTETDSDLGLDTVYEASDDLETPVLGEATGQKKGFAGWVWAAIAGLGLAGLGVVAWWFWPSVRNKKCKEGENGV